MHEASLHDANCFITLTYAPDYLPKGGGLVLKDFQDFMKRLRKKFGAGIRFFHCGEYGDKFGRPHYHACLFNFDFPDKILFEEEGDVRLYVSKVLSDLWPQGFSTIGDVTFESAAYVARYCTKKVAGDRAEDHYWRYDQRTGECWEIPPEYCTMSRRPGIAKGWFDRFHGDVYPCDSVTLRGGFEMKPPKAYDRYLELDNPELMASIKAKRKIEMEERGEESYERMAVIELCHELRFRKLKRGYENA